MGASAGMGGGVGMERRKPDFVSRRNEPATVDTTAIFFLLSAFTPIPQSSLYKIN